MKNVADKLNEINQEFGFQKQHDTVKEASVAVPEVIKVVKELKRPELHHTSGAVQVCWERMNCHVIILHVCNKKTRKVLGTYDANV